MHPVKVKPVFVLILAISVGVLLGADWLLIRQNSHLEAALQARATSMAPSVGMQVPELQGLAVGSKPISLGFGGDHRETVMLVFSTKCPLCDENWPYWESLARQLDTSRFRLVYVNISDSLSHQYASTHYFRPGNPIVATVDPQSRVDYSLSLSPMVLLIGSDATIRSVWLGVTKPSSKQDMGSRLGLTLAAVRSRDN